MTTLNSLKYGTKYPADSNTLYYLNDTLIEGTHWRNVFGNACYHVGWTTTFTNTPVGIYVIAIDTDSYTAHNADPNQPLLADISCYGDFDLLSPDIDRQSVTILDPENPLPQSHIIPGLDIMFRPFSYMTQGDKIHIAIGGIWVESEGRYVQFLSFGQLSSSGPATDSIEVTVENNSGVTLTGIEARIVNKLSVFQEQDVNDERKIPFKLIVQASKLSPKFDTYSDYPYVISFGEAS